MGEAVSGNATYQRLIDLLDKSGAEYRLIDHVPEGRTEIVSPMRGHRLSAAAKCVVLMVKLDKKTTRYVLAVLPGDRRVSFGAIAELYAARYVSFASSDIAEGLAGSVSGTILPFAFDPRLDLVGDSALLEADEIYFNAARLDRSIAIPTADYIRLAEPRLATISQSPEPEVEGGSETR